MKRFTLILLLGLVIGFLPSAAQADVVANWRVSMHSKSDTGGVCHLVRKNEFVGGAKIIEIGDPEQKWSLRAGSDDWVWGVQCWQPKGYCMRVYEYWGPIIGWVRVHRYWSRDRGRDAWFTIGTSEAGSRLKLRLTDHRCPKQPRLITR